ncbi:MAG TPA: DUF4230 domain-containing protein [Patescibacteria group bacterium]|nr:DUF4230 domain-containing protein [Patescibacteria group bacterium]
MSFQSVKRVTFLFLTFIILGILVLGIISLSHFFSNKAPYTFTANSRTVIKQIEGLNRLETAQFTIEKVIDAGTSGSALSQFLFGDKLLLIAQGEVIAGFDLSKVQLSDISVEGSTLRLTLPAPEILVSTLNNDQTRVYDRRTGLLTKGDQNLESKAREQAQTLITQAACDGHILDTASTNARNQLTALFKSTGFTTVIITIPQASCPNQ